MRVEDYLRKNIQELNDPTSLNKKNGVIETFVQSLASFKFFIPTRKKLKEDGIFVTLFGIALLLAAGYRGREIVPNYFPDSDLWQLGRFVLGVFIGYSIVLLILIVGLRYNSDERRRKKIVKYYKQRGLLNFSSNQYKEAAEVLKDFKKITYEEGIEKHGKEIIDLLLVAGAIFFDTESHFFKKKHFLKRLVSLKAIEKDQEA